jgi:hypothetical protein
MGRSGQPHGQNRVCEKRPAPASHCGVAGSPLRGGPKVLHLRGHQSTLACAGQRHERPLTQVLIVRAHRAQALGIGRDGQYLASPRTSTLDLGLSSRRWSVFGKTIREVAEKLPHLQVANQTGMLPLGKKQKLAEYLRWWVAQRPANRTTRGYIQIIGPWDAEGGPK